MHFYRSISDRSESARRRRYRRCCLTAAQRFSKRCARDGSLVVLASGCLLSGCQPPPPQPLSSDPVDVNRPIRPARIIAQGQLLPATGLIRLNGTPGDVVEKILVSIGQPVTAGQPLIELRSASVRQAQLETLKQQLDEATLQQEAAVDRARIELSAARMQLKQAEEQMRSTARREKSLPLLKQQWDDALAALERAQALAQDPLTRAMVSRLDVDKQRAAATTSQLQYEQQQESLLLASESAEWATKLAAETVNGAEKSLELAQKVDPSGVIRSQITSAEQQLAAARIVSPIDGTVVSIDARVGESVAQFPLLQVADLSRMICQVEIYQTDAPLVAIGQRAELRSDAFKKPLHGRVSRIDRLIGYPQLRATDPLAKVDYRTLPVLIEVDAEDTVDAAQWLQLQVEVTIPLEPASSPEHTGSLEPAGPERTDEDADSSRPALNDDLDDASARRASAESSAP